MRYASYKQTHLVNLSALARITVLFSLLGLGLARPAFGWQVKGTVSDSTGAALPYVSIFVENTTYGVASNPKGAYNLELENGTHRIIFQMVGFEKQIKEVTIKNSHQTLNVTLLPNSVELSQVTITAGRRDPAYEIIKSAIRNRKQYLRQYEAFKCNTYLKATLEKEPYKLEKVPDSILAKGVREHMNFVESYGTTWHERPNNWKEIKSAAKDLSEKSNSEVSVTINFEQEAAPPQYIEVNPYLYYLNQTDGDFNFYHNTLDIPKLGETPFTSPISATALVSYKYELIETFYEDGALTYKIRVEPRFREAPLFRGHIFIRDGDFNIKAVDLEIDRSSLHFFRYFRLFIEYDAINDSIWVPTREEFFYNTREGGQLMIGHTLAMYSNYEINPEIPKKFFRNEIKRTEDDAFDKDSAFWQSIRPVDLQENEAEYIRVQDSIVTHHESEDYLKEQDSIYNHHNFWDYTLNGIGFRNHAKKRRLYFPSLLDQIRPFGVGGYRHSFGVSYDQEFSDATALELDPQIDYGFQNKDLKGRLGVGYMYNPKRFGKFRLYFGDEYDLINTYESIQAILSRSNFVRKISYGMSHRMEFWNGVYLDGGWEFSDMKSIEGLELSQWSDELFGGTNTPQNFERYRQTVIKLGFQFSFFQKYYTEPNKKVIVGTDYPILNVNYRKGIPGLLGSDVSFDFLEAIVSDDFKIGTLGESKFRVVAGKFLTQKSIRFINHKFFRGSDPWFYSHPLRSFQLLGPSINTSNGYLQGHYVHHFNGALLNKIPLINKLGVQSVGGAGMLLIESNNLIQENNLVEAESFRHMEAFVGVEKPFRIGKQLLKIGCYFVAADSNYSELDGQIKFGIDFFNAFTNKWTY